MMRTTNIISPREFEILDLISRGFKIYEIANQLYISTHTVISHRKNIYQKLQVNNTASLIRRAFDQRILIPSPKVEGNTIKPVVYAA